MSLVDKEINALAKEKEEASKKLNAKRVNHITALQQLGTHSSYLDRPNARAHTHTCSREQAKMNKNENDYSTKSIIHES